MLHFVMTQSTEPSPVDSFVGSALSVSTGAESPLSPSLFLYF